MESATRCSARIIAAYLCTSESGQCVEACPHLSCRQRQSVIGDQLKTWWLERKLSLSSTGCPAGVADSLSVTGQLVKLLAFTLEASQTTVGFGRAG